MRLIQARISTRHCVSAAGLVLFTHAAYARKDVNHAMTLLHSFRIAVRYK